MRKTMVPVVLLLIAEVIVAAGNYQH